MKVYVVEWGDEFPAEIDTIWSTEPEAEKRADEMRRERRDPKWHVREWPVLEFHRADPQAIESTHA